VKGVNTVTEENVMTQNLNDIIIGIVLFKKKVFRKEKSYIIII
jgi:hypothetical protein